MFGRNRISSLLCITGILPDIFQNFVVFCYKSAKHFHIAVLSTSQINRRRNVVNKKQKTKNCQSMRFYAKGLLCASSCFVIVRNLLVTVAAAENAGAAPISGSLTARACSATRSFSANCGHDISASMSNTDKASDTYVPGTSSMVFVTTPNENLAKKLAHGLVEQKLAACVNIIPQIQSIYMWEGKVNEDNEYLMMIKTRSSRLDELIKWVRENHSYSVAEVISVPIEKGNLPYLNWITQTVHEKQGN